MKIVRNIFLAVFFLTQFGCMEEEASENAPFIKIFGGFRQEEVNEMVYDSINQRYVVLGSTNSGDFQGEDGNAIVDFDALLLFSDLEGNIQDTILYGGDDDDKGRAITMSADGHVLLAINTKDTVAEIRNQINNTSPENQSFISLLKVNLASPHDAPVVQRTYGFINDSIDVYGDVLAENTVSDIIEDSEGNILMIGSTNIVDTNKEGFNSATDKEDLLLIKTDPNGNIIFSKRYGNSRLDAGIGIVETDSGGYVLLGSTDRRKLDQVGLTTDRVTNILLIFINRNGDIQRTRVEGTNFNDVPKKIIRNSSGEGYAVVGHVTLNELSRRGFFLNVFSSNAVGEVKLSSPIDGGISAEYNSLKEFGTGYYVVGSSESTSEEDGNAGSNVMLSEQMTLFFLNSVGDVEDDPRKFGWEGDDAGNDLFITAERDIMISGTIDFGGESKVIGLIKTNTQGTLE